MGAHNLLRDLDLDRVARVKFLQGHIEFHTNLGSATLLLVSMSVTRSTTKELGKDVKRVVEPALASLLLLLQTFFSVAVVDSLLFLVRKNLVGLLGVRKKKTRMTGER